MFGLFRRRENELPSITPLQAQRNRQIETLKVCGHHVTEIQKDIEYRVNFSTRGLNLTLEIHLPPNFPHASPNIIISPPVCHPWVDERYNVVGAPGLIAFSMHSDLGRILDDIIKEFQTHAPESAPNSRSAAYPGNTSTEMMFTASSLYHPLPNLGASSGHIATTHTATSNYFPSLVDLNTVELQEIKDNDDKLLECVEKIPQIIHLNKTKKSIIEENENISKDNLKQKPVLEDLRKSILEKAEEMRKLQRQFDESSRAFDYLSDFNCPTNVRERLQVASLEAEEESEKVAEEFLEGHFTVEEFLQKFMTVRKQWHTRRVKEEKLQQQRF